MLLVEVLAFLCCSSRANVTGNELRLSIQGPSSRRARRVKAAEPASDNVAADTGESDVAAQEAFELFAAVDVGVGLVEDVLVALARRILALQGVCVTLQHCTQP